MAREMKDSGIEWIGEIPKAWEVAPLKRFAKIQTGNTPSKAYEALFYADEGILWIKPDNLGTGSPITYTTDYLTPEGRNAARVMPPNTVYVCCIGSLGKVGYSLIEGCCNQQINALIYNDRMYWKYGYYLTLAQESRYLLYGNGNVLQIINVTNQGNIECVVPSLSEQKDISNFLDKKCAELDNVLEKTRASIEEYKKLKQAVITQAVTRGVRGNREMKDSGVEWIGEIPEEWHMKKLRYLGRCQNGISKSSEYFGEGYPFVSYGDVYRNYQLPDMVMGLVMSTDSDRENYSVIRGDILFTRTSETIEEIGFSSVCLKTIENATFAGFVIRFRPHGNELLPEYSKYYFRSGIHRRFFVKEMNLVTRASLGQELLKKLPVILPSLKEQEEIANYLDKKCSAIDNLIAKKEQYLSEIENYKKSLIYEYVTGKKEVP